jgi:hypothetical protein
MRAALGARPKSRGEVQKVGGFMKARRSIVALAILIGAAPCCADSADEQVRALPLEKCTLDTVFMLTSEESSQLDLTMTGQQSELMQELGRISSAAKDKSRPIGEQIDKSAVGNFERVSQRFGALNLSRMAESKRTNDLLLIRRMVEVADHDQRWGEILDKNHPDFELQQVLEAFRALAKTEPQSKPEITAPADGFCSTDWALYKYEKPALDHMASLNLPAVYDQLKDIASRNQMDHIDREGLQRADKELFDHFVQTAIQPGSADEQFAEDMENIRLMARLSGLRYESAKQDILSYGGDLNFIDRTLSEKAKDFDKRSMLALGVWKQLDVTYPPPFMAQLKQLGDIMHPKK